MQPPDSYRFTIPGKPKVKGRPRFTKSGNTYTPKNTREREEQIRNLYGGPKFEGPVELHCLLSATETVVTITPYEAEKCPLQGDATNYLKAVEDALNGVAYDDDLQIYRIIGEKK